MCHFVAPETIYVVKWVRMVLDIVRAYGRMRMFPRQQNVNRQRYRL